MSWEVLIGGMLVVFLVVYALTGGADFGAGVWDLFARGPQAEKQRYLIAKAMGPIWEANHVWLIAIIVVLFINFPKAFAQLATALHIPLTIMLVGIVMRGSAFVFRDYDQATARLTWSRFFSVSSIATPVMLGMCLAAISSGSLPFDAAGEFNGSYLSDWCSWFTLAFGLTTLSVFAFLAATYLTTRTPDRHLQECFRRRALIAALVTAVLAWATYLAAGSEAPDFLQRFANHRAWLPFQIGMALIGITAFGLLVTRRYRLAQLAAGAQATWMILGWALAQFPYLIAGQTSVYEAAAPQNVLQTTFWVFVVGSCLLVPSMIYLYRVFAFNQVSESQ